MANQEHLAILNQGVEAWNTWRKLSPRVQLENRVWIVDKAIFEQSYEQVNEETYDTGK